jgi:hypothetical protein
VAQTSVRELTLSGATKELLVIYHLKFVIWSIEEASFGFSFFA